jgi:6-phosphogluconolactonase
LTGGSSPVGLYRLLAEDPWRSEVPWDRVHWFIGDERFVTETDPLSNMGAAPISRSGARPAAKYSPDPDRR